LAFHRFQLPAHDYTLPFYFMGLLPDGSKRSAQKPYLQESNNDQEEAETPVGPVGPSSAYRHGGKFADSYGLLCIFGSYGLMGIFGFWGLCRIDRGLLWSGWFILGSGLAIGIIGCVSGVIGCLPWDWGRCLHDGQEHTDYQYFHIPENVSQTLNNEFRLHLTSGSLPTNSLFLRPSTHGQKAHFPSQA
jgi:hypothetical protein